MAISKPVNSGYSYRNGTCFGSAGSKYDFWLEYKVIEQFPSTLESKVNTIIYLQRNDGYSNSAYNNYGKNYRKINNYGFNGNIDTRNNARVLLAQKEWIVKHEINGKKTFNVNAEFLIDALGLINGTLNTNIELPIIQVASTIEFSDYTLGEEFNATIKASNNMYTHNLKFYVLNQEVATRNNIPTNLIMRFTDDEEINIYNIMSNTIKTDFKILVTTFDTLGNPIGTTEKTKKIKINENENKPTLVNYRFDINGGLTGYGTANIKGKSSIAFDMVTFKAKNGAVMNKIKLQMGSEIVEKNYVGEGEWDDNLISLTSPDENVEYAYLTGIDSRGLETTLKYGQINLSPYITPKVLKLETYRKDGVGIETFLNLEMECWLGDAYGLTNDIIDFGYYTSASGEVGFNKTNEFKANYDYNNTTKTLILKDFPIHLNGTDNGFPLGVEDSIDIFMSIGVPSSVTDGPPVRFWTIPFKEGKVKITDGYVLEGKYKDVNGKYHRGYGGMPSPNYNHNFYGKANFNDDVNITGSLQVDGALITDFLTHKYRITGLSIGSGETITSYRNELVKAKMVVFFMSTSGSQFAQSVYFRSISTNFNFFIGSNSKVNVNNRMSGLYYTITTDGDIITSTFDYDGSTKITGFATFY